MFIVLLYMYFSWYRGNFQTREKASFDRDHAFPLSLCCFLLLIKNTAKNTSVVPKLTEHRYFWLTCADGIETSVVPKLTKHRYFWRNYADGIENSVVPKRQSTKISVVPTLKAQTLPSYLRWQTEHRNSVVPTLTASLPRWKTYSASGISQVLVVLPVYQRSSVINIDHFIRNF